ncbi:hypothetical protein DVH05_022180 [Phytophthora capsici]|nr:hypothetical protein DVH05_022180 [Phytophthora capsici]
MEGELSVLYADSTVAIIQISEILGKLNSPVFGPAQASKFRKYSLRDQKDIVAVVPCGPVRPTIFQSHSRLGVYTIVSAGSAPFLAFYQAGNYQNSSIHLAHIATAIASRAAGAVWSFATSWGWGEDQESMHLERGKERYMLNTLNLAQCDRCCSGACSSPNWHCIFLASLGRLKFAPDCIIFPALHGEDTSVNDMGRNSSRMPLYTRVLVKLHPQNASPV